jgi:alpha-D-xyloside xylohydrolase
MYLCSGSSRSKAGGFIVSCQLFELSTLSAAGKSEIEKHSITEKCWRWIEMKRLLITALLTSVSFLTAIAGTPYRLTEKGIVVSVTDTVANGAKMVRIEPITATIIRVSAVNADTFPDVGSLMIEKKAFPPVKWSAEESGDIVSLKTASLLVRVSTKTGALEFCDPDGKPVLTEMKDGGKTLEPVTLEGKHLYRIRDRFESPKDEAFYGLGQQQEGLFNYKGHDVDLYQYNTKISIPVVISNRNYGILWDNYSRSKFGNVADYGPLSSAFRLFDAENKEGGLSAKYSKLSDTSSVLIARDESQIDYEFTPDLKKLPSGYPLADGEVVWEGAFEPDSTGLYGFRLYSAGHCKMWIDKKLIVDRWRQSWNAFVHLFSIRLEKGTKHSIRIEWIPDGAESYISLGVKTPIRTSEQNDLSLYSEYGHQIDYYFISGKCIDDVIGGYRELTGKALIPPKWALGFWQSRERYRTQEELLQVANEYRKLKIPFDNIVQDWFYWPESEWGNMDFDTTRYPDPKAMVDEVHSLHEHIMISVWAKFYKGIRNFNRLLDKGYLYMGNLELKNRDWVGKGYLSTFYDPFNAGARKMFWQMVDEKLYPLGFDAWWLDSDEPDMQSNLPMETRKYVMDPTGMGPGAEYFNAFALEHCKGFYKGLMSADSNKRVFILSRSAYAGSQRFGAAVWSGDVASTWQDLKGQLPAGLNYSMSGLPYWTFDIGGFAVPAKFIDAKGAELEEWRELLTRWYEFGAFCPLYRSHGQFPYREIFNVAPEGSPQYDAIVAVTKLRYRLMPYIYSLAGKVYFDNYTIMRALVMDFESDMKVKNLSDEYLFGPSILVAPVTTYKARTKDVYLPAGTGWYDFYSGKYYEGGRWITCEAPLNRIPLFIREGSIIPTGPEIQYAEEKTKGEITLHVYAGKDGHFSLYEDEDNNNDYQRGIHSTIGFKWDQNRHELTIGKRHGEFPGMIADRTFTIVLYSPGQAAGFDSKPEAGKSVKYDGSEVSVVF